MKKEKEKEELKDINKENNEKIKKEENNLNNNSFLKDFEFILNRSKKVNKIIELNNPVKKIEYTYTREESYSDEILYYLTQINDKINQYKYASSLNNTNRKSNFHLYNLNYTTEINAFYEYELLKNNIHSNPKAYNVHEHRKVPFEEENRHGKRRNLQYFENKNFLKKNNYKNYYDNRRSVSYDKYNKYYFEKNYNTDFEKNDNKILYGVEKEYKSNYNDKYKKNANDNYGDDRDYSMDNAFERNRRRNKRKEYCSGLTTYDPFQKKKEKKYKEDNYDDYLY